jgi:mRNA-degrading endonuclease toxin of MazEF toxin-antitoxin module
VTFRRWDLISVPFPYVEGYEAKRRPALVISTDAFHNAHNACFAAMITTARHMQDVRKDDIAIAEWDKVGLPAPCVVRMARLSTFEAAPVIRRIGALAPVDRRAVAALIKRWFAV